jgi:hypothetical protein
MQDKVISTNTISPGYEIAFNSVIFTVTFCLGLGAYFFLH